MSSKKHDGSAKICVLLDRNTLFCKKKKKNNFRLADLNCRLLLLFFFVSAQNPSHRAFIKTFVPEHNVDDRMKRLKSGKYVTLSKCLYEKHFMEMENVPAAMLNDLRTTRTCLNQLYIGFGFVKHSPYAKPVNLVIQRVFESGLIDYWLSRVTEAHMSPATFQQVYEIKPRRNSSDRPSALSYSQFRVVMFIWIIGCAVSTVVFVVEHRWASPGRRRLR